MAELEQIKKMLNDYKNGADKAQIQEEFLLKQLKELFDCNSEEEGYELLNFFLSEKEELDKKEKLKIEELYEKLKSEGLKF